MCRQCECEGPAEVLYHGSILAVKYLADELSDLLGRPVNFCQVHRLAIRHLRNSLRVVKRKAPDVQELYRQSFEKLSRELEGHSA